MTNKVINLCRFIGNNEHVLIGRTEGNKVIDFYDLDRIDFEKDTIITVYVNTNIWSLNASFFIGCFSRSVHNLGDFGFREKYIFDVEEHIQSNIDDGISRSLYEYRVNK